MGMPTASVQQSPNQSGGKGFAQPTGLRPQGDYGDPAFDRPQPMPADLQMANQVMGGQNGQPDASMMAPAVMPHRQNQPMFDQGGISARFGRMSDKLKNGTFEPFANSPVGMQNTQPQPMGKGGSNVTMPGQGRQPRMGQPNAYSNTIQPWDNASIQPQKQSGKGKGY